jgi:hypothetical protein
MIICELLGLLPGDDADLPPFDAPDRYLVRWLEARFRRPPVWFEVLELRFLLRALARRRARWAWWRRLRPLRLPARKDLVAEFLATPEGQLLLRALGGSIAALVARLALTDPFEGFDGRHPTGARWTRLERLRERTARGGTAPPWAQAEAAVAYGEWKVRGVPVLAPGLIPKPVEFLMPAHAAALNAMSPSEVAAITQRLRKTRCSDSGRRAALGYLDRVGAKAIQLWPGIQRRCPTPPLGLWPLPEKSEPINDAPAAPTLAPGPPS